MILRCTARAAALLVGPRSDLARPPADDDDWYANVFWVDRRKCLLLMHAGTLFPVFVADVRAPHWRPPGRPVTIAIELALAREQLPADTFGMLDPETVTTAATASRQLLGFMTETVHACRYAADRAGALDALDVDALNDQLCRLLHNRGGYHTPLDLIKQRRRQPLTCGRRQCPMAAG